MQRTVNLNSYLRVVICALKLRKLIILCFANKYIILSTKTCMMTFYYFNLFNTFESLVSNIHNID